MNQYVTPTIIPPVMFPSVTQNRLFDAATGSNARCLAARPCPRSICPAHFGDRGLLSLGRRLSYLPSTGILLCFLTASGVLASSIVSTPLANFAAIFSGSTPIGISTNRSNEPYSRSRR